MKAVVFGFILLLLLLLPCISFEQSTNQNIKLPGFFGDNMVLQRDKPVKFWGTALPNTSFALEFAGKTKTVASNANGEWEAIFSKQKAGDVFELKVNSSNPFSYKNILMGDVWLTSGQSNMEFTFGNTDSVALDMLENPNIRYVSMPYGISNYPQNDVRKIAWQLCTKETAQGFSAVAYYFAQKINKQTGVPIGIINSSWGGTGIKAWTSEKGIVNIPEYKFLLDTFLSKRHTAQAIDSVNARNYAITNNNDSKVYAADKGYKEQWQKGTIGSAEWLPIELPGTWQTGKFKDFDGILWFRKEIELPADFKDDIFSIKYGVIVGLSEMYINGIKVGTNNYKPNQNRFFLKPGTLVSGKNVLVIRVVDNDSAAAFRSLPSDMMIQSKNANRPFQFSIAGQWQFTPTLTASELAVLTKKVEVAPPNTSVSSIFNVKVHPLLPLAFKGILWYQGENESPVGYFYRTLFKNMINDWREQFSQGDLPFIFAQLPGYGKIKNEPVESSEWADIRESQAMALSLPKTGMAVTIELGNPTDIHPHNKKPVGERMANEAMKMVYGFKDAPQSPMLKSFTIKGNEVHLFFSNVGDGLSVRNGNLLKGFAIADANKSFIWGDAKIFGKNEIVVSSSTIAQPVSVRYAWGSSPVEANATNSFGLPVAPFRTDDWPLKTSGKVDNY